MAGDLATCDSPIWRRAYRAASPDGRHVAEIERASEVSMGNPTRGTLRVTCGIDLEGCNPSFLWSDDSRYLAVPQYVPRFGLLRGQRMLVIDVLCRRVHASKERAWYFQPETFCGGRLVARRNPHRRASQMAWNVPADLASLPVGDIPWTPAPQPPGGPADPADILAIFDACYATNALPVLDNGYIYPAAARLSLFRSAVDWGLVMETFGYSPRAGLPDTWISTIASRFADTEDRQPRRGTHADDDVAQPLGDGPWMDGESVAGDAREVVVRGEVVALPSRGEYARLGIALETPPGVKVFELCRYLAETRRDLVLATPGERRASLLPEMQQILQLEEWRHPDHVSGERPSDCESFQQLATVLAVGDPRAYRTTERPNSHWSHWPDAGTL